MISKNIFQRVLGATGISISALGLGTVKLGRDQSVKYPSGFTIPSDAEAANLLAAATDLGINLLDTAPAYGVSEERIGKLLQGQRHQWVICTKAGEEFDNGQSHYNFSAAYIRQSVERSLRRLQTDVIDIVLIHSDGNDIAIIEEHGALATLTQLKQEGLIRAIGMSTKTVAGGLLAAQHSDCVMVTYNLQQPQEQPVLDYCLTNNKGVLLKKVFASGHLVNKAGSNALEQSLRFVFSHSAVSSAIVGTINPTHLRDNVDTALRCCSN